MKARSVGLTGSRSSQRSTRSDLSLDDESFLIAESSPRAHSIEAIVYPLAVRTACNWVKVSRFEALAMVAMGLQRSNGVRSLCRGCWASSEVTGSATKVTARIKDTRKDFIHSS